MNIVTLLQPPRIVFGNGCAPQCVDYLAQRGVKRLLFREERGLLFGRQLIEGSALRCRAKAREQIVLPRRELLGR